MDENKLVNGKGLLEALFEESCRPSLDWLGNQVQARTIPFIRIGRLIFFDVRQVREYLASRPTTKPRN